MRYAYTATIAHETLPFHPCPRAIWPKVRQAGSPKQPLVLLAGLVSDRAACLASRLAGCLALAASALLHGTVQPFRVQSLNVFHGKTSFNIRLHQQNCRRHLPGGKIRLPDLPRPLQAAQNAYILTQCLQKRKHFLSVILRFPPQHSRYNNSQPVPSGS